NDWNPVQSVQVFPPSVERYKWLGSVPAQTTARPSTRSLALTATLSTRLCAIPSPTGYHVSPASSLIQSPLSNDPPYNRPSLVESTAKHRKLCGVVFSRKSQSASFCKTSNIAFPAEEYSALIIWYLLFNYHNFNIIIA